MLGDPRHRRPPPAPRAGVEPVEDGLRFARHGPRRRPTGPRRCTRDRPRAGGARRGGLRFDLRPRARRRRDDRASRYDLQRGASDPPATAARRAATAPPDARRAPRVRRRRRAVQPHPRALARRPADAALAARRARLLRGRRALVRDAVRPRQPDHRDRDARLRRPAWPSSTLRAARRAARPSATTRARRGARQGPARAARRRGRRARPHAARPLLRHASTPRRCSSACSAEHADWSGDLDAVPRAARRRSRRRSGGSTGYGDRDGDGLLEYRARARPTGCATRAGRTPTTASCDDDGEPLEPPIALVEAQGYVVARQARDGAAVRARRRRRRAPTRCAREADALEARARALLAARRGGYYAMALDGDGRPSARARLQPGPPAVGGRRRAPSAPARVRDALMGERHVLAAGGSARSAQRRGRLQPRRLPPRHGVAARHAR